MKLVLANNYKEVFLDYYLTSDYLTLQGIRKCTLLKILKYKTTNLPALFVSVDKPITYDDNGIKLNVNEIVLLSRYSDQNILDISSSHCTVYVCLLKTKYNGGDTIYFDDIINYAIGYLYLDINLAKKRYKSRRDIRFN